MRSAWIALATLVGCSKGLAGDYTGTLDETCSITRATNVVGGPGGLTGTVTSCGGGGSKTGFVLHVVRGTVKDKLEIDLEGCKLALTDRDSTASIDPGQTCMLSVTGYKGKTTVDGTLTASGDKDVHVTIDFYAAEPQTSGAFVVDFTGSRAK